MRNLGALLFSLMIVTIQAQAQNGLGADDSPTLNKQEVQFLDSLLREQRHEFASTNKRVAFLYGGSTGNGIQTKSAFFQRNVLPWTSKGNKPALLLIALTAAEKRSSGGYDALIVAWAKLFTEQQRARMLKQLAKAGQPSSGH